MIKTYILDSAALPDPLEEEACMQGLPRERVEKIRRIRHPEIRRQSLGAGLLLENALSQLAPDAAITYNPYGKPVCQQAPFSLSHTMGYAMLSIWSGPGQPFATGEAAFSVGCDIERIGLYRPRLARRFFTEAEYQSLEAVEDPQAQAELFCRYWTKKESVMKLTGLGMSLPMDLFDVRGGQVAVNREKTMEWRGAGLQHRPRTQNGSAFQHAVGILLDRELFFKEYRYLDCCITVCGLADRFAPEILQAFPAFL